ncbi:hypothetical protein SA2016_0938 [Sinomonas atrocyanea]|uniref:Uncharacterized protein n=2 Tax=Sinomonas atrocyanea TaxID=37927 RepID=A0A126ZYI4_9MICC|nr:hypothetical protein SA2016_0938 [Sinomonas atrocyanea]
MFDGRTLRGEATADPLRDVDFAQATFANVEFRGYRLDRVRLPEGVRAIPHWPEVARHALELVARDRSTEGRMLAGEFRNWMNMIGQGDATGVFNRADYVTAGGEKLAQFAESVLWRTVEPERR